MDSTVEDLRKAVNDYRQTVQALCALAHELQWNDDKRTMHAGAVASFGRRMDTTPENPVSPQTEVTPDLVLERKDGYRVVAEAKIGLPSDSRYRKKTLGGVQKYDDDLEGWVLDPPTPRIHDCALLVKHFHGKAVVRDLSAMRANNVLVFSRNLAVIAFSIVQETEIFLSLDLLDGELGDKAKQDKFEERPVGISVEHIEQNQQVGDLRLYDARPPLPHLMMLIHELIFNDLSDDQLFALGEEGVVKVEVMVSELRQQLSTEFGPGRSGPRVPDIPTETWVRDSMQLFVQLDWAEPMEGAPPSYVYFVKNRRKPYEQFLKLCAEKKSETTAETGGQEKQLSLLPGDED